MSVFKTLAVYYNVFKIMKISYSGLALGDSNQFLHRLSTIAWNEVA